MQISNLLACIGFTRLGKSTLPDSQWWWSDSSVSELLVVDLFGHSLLHRKILVDSSLCSELADEANVGTADSSQRGSGWVACGWCVSSVRPSARRLHWALPLQDLEVLNIIPNDPPPLWVILCQGFSGVIAAFIQRGFESFLKSIRLSSWQSPRTWVSASGD